MKNLKDYIGKPYNIICANKEEWDAIVDLAIQLDYLVDGKNNTYIKGCYSPNRYLGLNAKENLTRGNLPCPTSDRTNIKASEFLPTIEPKEVDKWIGKTVRITQATKDKGKIGKVLNRSTYTTISKYYVIEGCGHDYLENQFEEVIETPVDKSKAVVHCKTLDEFNFVTEKLNKRWTNSNTSDLWNSYKEDTAICLNNLEYSGVKIYWSKNGYYIYSFDEWCKEFGHSMKVEYIEIVKQSTASHANLYKQTIGKIFKVVDEGSGDYYIEDPNGNKDVVAKNRVKPSTKEAYDKQNGKTMHELISYPRYVYCIDYGKEWDKKVFDTSKPHGIPLNTLTWKRILVENGRLDNVHFREATKEEYEAFISKTNKTMPELVKVKPEFKRGDKVFVVAANPEGYADYKSSVKQRSLSGKIAIFNSYQEDSRKEHCYIVAYEDNTYGVHKIEHYKEKKSLDLSKPFCILLTLDNQVRVQNILGSDYFNNLNSFNFTDIGYYYGVNLDGKIGSKRMLPTNLEYFGNTEVTIEELEEAYSRLGTQPAIRRYTYEVVGTESDRILSQLPTFLQPIQVVKGIGKFEFMGGIDPFLQELKNEFEPKEFRLTKPTKTFKDTTITFPTQINIKLKTNYENQKRS